MKKIAKCCLFLTFRSMYFYLPKWIWSDANCKYLFEKTQNNIIDGSRSGQFFSSNHNFVIFFFYLQRLNLFEMTLFRTFGNSLLHTQCVFYYVIHSVQLLFMCCNLSLRSVLRSCFIVPCKKKCTQRKKKEFEMMQKCQWAKNNVLFGFHISSNATVELSIVQFIFIWSNQISVRATMHTRTENISKIVRSFV